MKRRRHACFSTCPNRHFPRFLVCRDIKVFSFSRAACLTTAMHFRCRFFLTLDSAWSVPYTIERSRKFFYGTRNSTRTIHSDRREEHCQRFSGLALVCAERRRCSHRNVSKAEGGSSSRECAKSFLQQVQ